MRIKLNEIMHAKQSQHLAWTTGKSQERATLSLGTLYSFLALFGFQNTYVTIQMIIFKPL